MTHDPLCPLVQSECPGRDRPHFIVEGDTWCGGCQIECQCPLIAKVRADTRCMTHDPYCTQQPYNPWRPCYCDVIAQVRADERNKIFTHLDELSSNNHVDYCRDLYCGGCYELGDNE